MLLCSIVFLSARPILSVISAGHGICHKRCGPGDASLRHTASTVCAGECPLDPGGYFVVKVCCVAVNLPACAYASHAGAAVSPMAGPQGTRLLRRRLHFLQGTEKVVLIQEQLSKNRIIVDIDNHGQVRSWQCFAAIHCKAGSCGTAERPLACTTAYAVLASVSAGQCQCDQLDARAQVQDHHHRETRTLLPEAQRLWVSC